MTGQQIIDCRASLATTRAALQEHWRELSELYLPFRAIDSAGRPDLISAADTHDSTPRRCALILANGLASLLSAREDQWFGFAPPRHLRKDDEAVRFYRDATEAIRELLEASNFYQEIQECYIEAPVFGTTCLFTGDFGDRAELYFRNQPIGTYYITEDARGRVNSLYRDLHLTADQAAEEFGRENLPREILNKVGNPQAKTETAEYIHAVFSRPSHRLDPDASESDRKPWVSLTVEVRSKKIVQTGGFDEFPFAVHRYRRYGKCVWGFGPGTTAIGDPRQLQFLNQLVDVGTERAVFPPVIAPTTLEGEIGLGALEITYVDPADPNSAAILKEWAPSGRLDHAAARLDDKRRQLEAAFHVDLFQLFSQRSQERAPLTATEAQLIAGEKLAQFSPVHGRVISELLSPTLLRIFGLALRAGRLGEPPLAVTSALAGGRGVASPTVTYQNRVVLAMQSRQNLLLRDHLELVGPMLAFKPEGADLFDFSEIFRDTARNAGLPEDWINDRDQVAAIAAERAKVQEQQLQLAQAEQASKVAANVGKAPPEMRRQLNGGLANFSTP